MAATQWEQLPPDGADVPLGPPIVEVWLCGRLVAGVPCGEPAFIHVVWNAELDNSAACVAHAADSLSRYSWIAWHAVESDCGMPNSRFYGAENCCRVPAGGAEQTLALAAMAAG